MEDQAVEKQGYINICDHVNGGLWVVDISIEGEGQKHSIINTRDAIAHWQQLIGYIPKDFSGKMRIFSNTNGDQNLKELDFFYLQTFMSTLQNIRADIGFYMTGFKFLSSED